MTTGFVQRFKGKIGVVYGGLYQSGGAAIAVFTNAGIPTSGAAGTLFNRAGPGALLVDTTNKTLYQNTNTLASPTWTQLTAVGGAGSYTGTFDGTVGGTSSAVGTFTFARESVSTGLTATGSTAAGAATVSAAINVVATSHPGTGVAVLSAATVGIGGHQIIYNDGTSAIQIYAPTGSDTIDGTAGSTGVALTAARRAEFRVVASSTFKSALLGAVSS